MTGDRDDTIRELLDRTAIRDVLLRYARGVDRRDVELVASCFLPGARYEGALGQGTIEGALDALRERLARYEGTMHFIGNQLIEVHGDTARSETYAVAYHRRCERGAPQLLSVGLRYVDDLVRSDGKWRIQCRVVFREWQRREPLDESPWT